MPDPYAAKGAPRATVPETRSQLDQFLARLTDLGAEPDELQLVRDSWDDLDPDDDTDPDAFTAARRAELVSMPDDKLAGLLAASRDEYEVGTTTEEEAEQARAAAEYRDAYREAAERIGGNVDSVLAWVADDPVRAQAVLDLERSSDGADRKTLVKPLAELMGEYNPDQAPTTEPPAVPAGPDGGPGPEVPEGTSEPTTGDQGPESSQGS